MNLSKFYRVFKHFFANVRAFFKLFNWIFAFETFTFDLIEVGFLIFEIIFLIPCGIEELWRMSFFDLKNKQKIKVPKTRFKLHSSKENCSKPIFTNFQEFMSSMTHYNLHLVLNFSLLEEFFNVVWITWLTQELN